MEQFQEAMDYEGDDVVAMILHTLNFPWKILFACLPPTAYYNGWLTFYTSLGAIGATTYVIGELASTWGCMMGIEDAIVALTVVALGTSMPDTFASKTAVEQAPDADAAIGNVTGSNSVNVFLGLGLPWMIATIYHGIDDSDYKVSEGTLSFSVIVFIPLAICALGTFVYLEKTGKGALGGGPETRRKITYGFAFFWFFLS
eukprot:UN24176